MCQIDTTYAAVLKDAQITFGNNKVLKGLNLHLKTGEIVSLLGKSGSGKSTTLRVLAGLTALDTGELIINNAPAVAFQQPRLFPWQSVAANIAHGLRGRKNKNEVKAAVENILMEVELPEKSGDFPGALSGGQQQRVSLARALVSEPELILLDEPFSALDALTRLVMHRLLLKLWKEHQFAVLLLTHDIDEAIVLSDRILILGQGEIAEEIIIIRPREIDRGDSDFSEYRNHILRALGY